MCKNPGVKKLQSLVGHGQISKVYRLMEETSPPNNQKDESLNKNLEGRTLRTGQVKVKTCGKRGHMDPR